MANRLWVVNLSSNRIYSLEIIIGNYIIFSTRTSGSICTIYSIIYNLLINCVELNIIGNTFIPKSELSWFSIRCFPPFQQPGTPMPQAYPTQESGFPPPQQMGYPVLPQPGFPNKPRANSDSDTTQPNARTLPARPLPVPTIETEYVSGKKQSNIWLVSWFYNRNNNMTPFIKIRHDPTSQIKSARIKF